MENKKCKYCNEVHKNSNTGCRNTGDYNTGDYNTGDRNSGDYNSGYYNSGHYNTGDRNSGYYNSGHYNTGDYNTGDRNSGWFNTNEPKMRFFNKDSNITYSEFSKKPWVYPDLKICAWVDIKDLPESEQSETAKQMGGLLKTLTYKEAWREYWGRASDSDKEWFKSLPNFDADIFEEITGIKIDEPLNLSGQEVEVKVGGKVYKAVIK